MLPDLPSLKQDMEHIFYQYLRKRTNQRLEVLGELPKHFMHEGNRMRTRRANGSVEETKLKRALGEISLKVSDIPALTFEQRIAELDKVAGQVADQIGTHSLKTLSESLDKAGQVVDRKGKPFDAEAVFELLEKLQIEFDESGKSDLTILIPPAFGPRAEELL